MVGINKRLLIPMTKILLIKYESEGNLTTNSSFLPKIAMQSFIKTSSFVELFMIFGQLESKFVKIRVHSDHSVISK
jgi:hypothetical protein